MAMQIKFAHEMTVYTVEDAARRLAELVTSGDTGLIIAADGATSVVLSLDNYNCAAGFAMAMVDHFGDSDVLECTPNG
jgi:hypothetical protein